MITWADIKLITFQKMFAADGDQIPTDSSARDYSASMPGAANEALQLLATAGKFIIKSIDIAHNPVKNLLTNTDKITSIERGTLEYNSDGVRSYFFECFGKGEYSISVDGVEVLTESFNSGTGYTQIKGLVENEDDKNVVLKISSLYPLAVKNVALYSANFETVEEIPTYAEK